MSSLALLLVGLAAAEPPAGLSPVAVEIWERAERLEARGELVRARSAWRSVFEVTDRPEAALEAARLHADAGEVDAALELLDLAPQERDVLVARVTLLLRADRQQAATEALEALAGYSADRDVVRLRALALADRDPLAAAEVARDWLGFATNEPLDPADAEEIALILARRLREAGEQGAAVDLLDRVEAVVPETAEAIAAERRRASVEQLAAQLARSGAEPLGPSQRSRLAEARTLWEAGEAEAAAGVLDAMGVVAPRNPEVRGLRARVLLDLGRASEAEVELLAAERLDPLDARWPALLGQVLATTYAGRFHDEAVQAWERSLALDPRNTELWLRKARLEVALGSGGDAGWRRRAARSLERVISLQPEGPLEAEAQRLLDGLAQQRPPPPDLPAGQACRRGIPTEACDRYHLAFAWWQRARMASSHDPAADLDAALDEARAAARLVPTWERPVNLQAHLLRMRGEGSGDGAAADRAESERLYRRSLELSPDQPAIHVHLGKLAEREGDRAAALEAWRRAVALGGPGAAPAHLYLAEEALGSLRVWEVREHLGAYRRAGAGTAELDAHADRLEQRVARLETTGLGIAAGALGLALGVPAVWWWRRRQGRSVAELLQADPSVWREVAGIASALRHEVLKHHTSVLPAIADALEVGEDGPALWMAERIGASDGPVARGRRYLSSLGELGRRSGIRLDLARRDPVFGPLLDGLDRLAALERPLARGAARVVPELRAVAERLNEQAYPALGALVQRICVLRVDIDMLRQAWRAVLGEPAFREIAPHEPVFELPERPIRVRIWRDDLHLVLVNLLRNALEASDGRGPIGLRLVIEEDPVTFLERVAIRVLDQAPRTVSTAMIRGRYIDRGLGLTVDVISRNAGSIHVEDEPGWTKAIVVRLPMVEVAADPLEDA